VGDTELSKNYRGKRRKEHCMITKDIATCSQKKGDRDEDRRISGGDVFARTARSFGFVPRQLKGSSLVDQQSSSSPFYTK
jgi:hypothetical protein